MDKAIIIKSADVSAKGRHPEDILSNLCDNDFCFGDVQCSSMESFLQSLKYQDIEIQKKVCLESPRRIKNHDTVDWQTDQTLWWKGQPISRHSFAYVRLIYKAYCELYRWCGRFRDALMGTVGKKLHYDTGANNPQETVLTDKEFIRILTKLRRCREFEYKHVRYPRLWPNSYGVSEDYE